MNDYSTITGNNIQTNNCLLAPFSVKAFQGYASCRVYMDPMIFPLNPKRCLINMHRWRLKNFFSCLYFPNFESLIKAPDNFKQARLGYDCTNHCGDLFLDPVQGNQLANYQMNGKCLEMATQN